MDPITRLSALGAAGAGQIPTEYFRLFFQGSGGALVSVCSVDTDSNNNIYISGIDNVDDSFVMKLDSQGNKIWGKTTSLSRFYDSTVKVVGSTVYVVAYAGTAGADIISLDLDGNVNWCNNYQDPTYRSAGIVGQRPEFDANGNIYLKYGQASTQTGFGFGKINSSGTLQFAVTSTPAQYIYSTYYGLALDSSANVFIFFRTARQSGAYTINNVVNKYNSSGVKQWSSWHGPSSGTVLNQMHGDPCIDSNGNMYMIDKYNNQFIKWNSSGAITAAFDAPTDYDIATVDPSDNLWFTRWADRYVTTYNSSLNGRWRWQVDTNNSIKGEPRFNTSNNAYYIPGSFNKDGKGFLYSLPYDGSLQGTVSTSWDYITTTPANLNSQTVALSAASDPGTMNDFFVTSLITTTAKSTATSDYSPTITAEYI